MLRRWLKERRDLDDGTVLGQMMYDRKWWGSHELGAELKMRSGRLYPSLRRLLEKGFIEDKWDELEPRRTHRRKFYRAKVIGKIIDPNEAST